MLALNLALLGAALGFGISALRTPIYTAESRIAVGGDDLSAQAIPGYALGSQQLAASYARYVNNSAAQAGQSLQDRTSVAASPIPESNIIRVEGFAPSATQAVGACKGAADSLIAQLNAVKQQSDPAQVLDQLTQSSRQLAEQQQKVDDASAALNQAVAAVATPRVEAARAALVAARAELGSSQVKRDALSALYSRLVAENRTAVTLKVVREAAVVSSDASSTRQRFGLLGLVAGLATALALAATRDRRRLMSPASVAAEHGPPRERGDMASSAVNAPEAVNAPYAANASAPRPIATLKATAARPPLPAAKRNRRRVASGNRQGEPSNSPARK